MSAVASPPPEKKRRKVGPDDVKLAAGPYDPILSTLLYQTTLISRVIGGVGSIPPFFHFDTMDKQRKLIARARDLALDAAKPPPAIMSVANYCDLMKLQLKGWERERDACLKQSLFDKPDDELRTQALLLMHMLELTMLRSLREQLVPAEPLPLSVRAKHQLAEALQDAKQKQAVLDGLSVPWHHMRQWMKEGGDILLGNYVFAADVLYDEWCLSQKDGPVREMYESFHRHVHQPEFEADMVALLDKVDNAQQQQPDNKK